MFPPVTLPHIRGHGCRGVLVYCESIWCNHSAEIDTDWLPDKTVIGSLGGVWYARLADSSARM
jgi:hypothetical protein